VSIDCSRCVLRATAAAIVSTGATNASGAFVQRAAGTTNWVTGSGGEHLKYLVYAGQWLVAACAWSSAAHA
jgi:hypothetical protein